MSANGKAAVQIQPGSFRLVPIPAVQFSQISTAKNAGTCRCFRRQQLEVSWSYPGYPNKPACGGALLPGNGLNSFDSVFLAKWQVSA